MNATNHAAVGAIIGLVVKEPVITFPLALLSHLILDAIPHYGIKDDGLGEFFKQKLTPYFACFDFIGLVVLTLLIYKSGWVVLAAAFIAISPDFIWFYRFAVMEKFGKIPPVKGGMVVQFLTKIQWSEKPWGILIEVPLSIILLSTVWNITS